MDSAVNRWALILAAGAGTRLSSLTRVGDSDAVPKQFCSLAGGASLLEDTFARACSVATPGRTLVVVAAEHRAFWDGAVPDILTHNIIVQPQNRGTAIGILLGVAAILERDLDAKLVVLPSDHYVENEAVLRQCIVRSLTSLAPESAVVSFLGIKPESADPELGYIVRGAAHRDGSSRIAEFVEKPSRRNARQLRARSALWNSFILVARARALVELIDQLHPSEVSMLFRAVRSFANDRGRALEQVYARLPSIDFSRHVAQKTKAELKVIPVPACGWSDLGTPGRVVECLARLTRRPSQETTHLSLADAHSSLAGLSAAADSCG